MLTTAFSIGSRVCRLNDRGMRFPGSIVGMSNEYAVVTFDSKPFASVRLSIRKLKPVEDETRKAGRR